MNATDIQTIIQEDIDKHPIILFMKGSKLMPLCGFSRQVVAILHEYGIPFETRNVLENEELRSEIKTYSNWPTIPQLYVNKTFVGGCDVITQLHETGELKSILDS